MKLKYVIFLFLLTCTNSRVLYGQKNINPFASDFKTYGVKEGYKVYDIWSLEFDNLGWLWIVGIQLEIANNNLHHRKPIIQRFSGETFQDVPLPVFEDEDNYEIKLFKQSDGTLLARFKFEGHLRFYRISASSLVFEELPFDDSSDVLDAYIFPHRDGFMVFMRHRSSRISLHTLDSKGSFSLINPELSLGENASAIEYPHFTDFIAFEDHIIGSEVRSGVHTYSMDGNYISTVTLRDLGITDRKIDHILEISTWFKKEEEVYVQFREVPGYYRYVLAERKWEKVTPFLDNELKGKVTTDELIYFDGLGNEIRQQLYTQGVMLTRYLDHGNRKIDNPLGGDRFLETISRDLNKELFVGNSGILYHFNEEQAEAQTFLEGKSIRAILELSPNKIVVATQNLGWYIIDLESGEIDSFDTKLNGLTYVIQDSRNLFLAENGIWGGYDKGIIWVDKETGIARSFVDYPTACLTEAQDFIYYGTHRYKLMRFDKRQEKLEALIDTPEFDMQGIIKIEEVIYITSAQGLLLYEGGDLQLFTPENSEDTFLIAIAQHEEFGLLIGSASGKLFRFDTIEKTFELLYEDELNASIASLLFDDEGAIWLNTYNGIVSFNPQSNEIARYSEKDGLSFNETNRYSALKTKDGHFLVGTLNGLTYFDPSQMEKNSVQANLHLVTASFSDEGGEEVTLQRPHQLDALAKLELPAANRNVLLEYSLLGSYNPELVNYRYRLGGEEEWINLPNRPEIRLLNLNSGIYHLEVEALDSGKIRIGDPKKIEIVVQEFFYRTYWFYFLIALVVSIVALLLLLQERRKYKLVENFSSRIIISQEQERSRIAKELHDSVGQSLLLLKNAALDRESPSHTEITMLNDTIQEVREMSHNLHPFQFEKLGLVKSIEDMMSSFQKSSRTFYSYEIEDISGLIHEDKELFVFRMLQECVVNVEKHAGATACNLKVLAKEKDVLFLLKDNGVGFDVNETHEESGLGLKSLKERSQYINAYFNIESRVQKGTTITIKVPKV